MIFHLPNGLQGYYLVDGKDSYITRGPVDVVSDQKMRSGTTEIVNGLSCMCCHVKGMIDSVLDDVRAGTAVQGDALRKVKRLYPPRPQVLKLVEEDRDLFLAALKKAMTPYLIGEDKDRKIDEVKEPITELVQEYYHPDPKIDVVAYELGFEKPEELRAAIRNNEKLRDLGLRTLIADGVIKREFWDNGDRLEKPEEDGQSLFHRTARALGRGSRRVPLR
jgi:serine/threonine-protein kinase